MEPFLKGVGVALATPFRQDKDKSIDFEALARLVDYVVAGGVDYVVALGTTAETPTLFPEERDEVLALVKRQVAGRVPVVAGIGGNNTAAVIKAIGSCDLDGVSAVLSVTPFYNRPSQRGLYEHYKVIAEASPLPVILYNVPSRTGVNMLPETTLKLARELANIVAVKEAEGSIGQLEALLAGRPEGFGVISGDDATALPLAEMGGDGVISVAANAFPHRYVKMIRDAFAGDTESARGVWREVAEVTKALFAEGNPTGVKAALHVRGIAQNVLRLPLVESSPELYGRIERLMREGGL